MEAKTIQKYKGQTVAKLLKKAQNKFNAFIRERDDWGGYFVCISCGEQKSTKGGQYQAGHYYSAGHNSLLRFNEDNVHGQCKRCNYFLSGNQIGYQKYLLSRIGKYRLQKLEELAAVNKRMIAKWDRFELIDIIEKYK